MRISRSVMAVGGVVFAAVLIGFTNPKAVQAVTAALVQVTNTSSNPVVSSDVTLSAANLVELKCYVGEPCSQVEPGGALAIGYKVAAGQTLVITDVIIQPYSLSGNLSYLQLTSSSPGLAALVLYVPGDGLSHNFALTHGVAWPSGSQLTADGNINQVFLIGYLTNS